MIFLADWASWVKMIIWTWLNSYLSHLVWPSSSLTPTIFDSLPSSVVFLSPSLSLFAHTHTQAHSPLLSSHTHFLSLIQSNSLKFSLTQIHSLTQTSTLYHSRSSTHALSVTTRTHSLSLSLSFLKLKSAKQRDAWMFVGQVLRWDEYFCKDGETCD